MSGTISQPPWQVLAEAAARGDIMSIAYMSAAAVALTVLAAGGGAIASDPAGTTYTAEQTAARLGLAIKVVGHKIDDHTLTVALVLVPEVAAALAANPSDPPGQLSSVDLPTLWGRSWTAYASVIAAIG